jgi:hypothetical protein
MRLAVLTWGNVGRPRGAPVAGTTALGSVGARAPCARRCFVEMPLPDVIASGAIPESLICGLVRRRGGFEMKAEVFAWMTGVVFPGMVGVAFVGGRDDFGRGKGRRGGTFDGTSWGEDGSEKRPDTESLAAREVLCSATFCFPYMLNMLESQEIRLLLGGLTLSIKMLGSCWEITGVNVFDRRWIGSRGRSTVFFA